MVNTFSPKMLQYLDSIIEHGTFTKAAKALYISQPYLTQFIQNVEESLGITIIDRSSKPLRLTNTGHHYYRQLQDLIHQMNRIEREFQMYTKPWKETIRIGILPYLGQYLLPLLIPDFSKEYSFYNFEIIEQLPTKSEEDLVKNEIDFYIGQTPETVNMTFKRIVSMEQRYYVIIPKNSTFFTENETIITEPPFELKDLLTEPFVLTKQGSAIRKQIDELFHNFRLVPNSIMESENIYTVADFARKGVGLTIVPKNVLLPIEDFKDYNLYKLPADLITIQYFISYLPDKKLSSIEEHFIQFFKKKMDGTHIR